MNASELNISAFARTAGLTPSALRFYDDCGILRPARVDPATGYRYYTPGQQDRAVLLRTLRQAGLPLAEVAVALDGSEADRRRLLRAHLGRLRAEQAAATAAAEELLRALPEPGLELVLGGAELASATRQVVPAARASEEYPQLGYVLIELDDAEARLVATDRYRLALRVLKPASCRGGPAQLLVAAADLLELGQWAAWQPLVTLEPAEGGVLVSAGGDRRLLPVADVEFPSYRDVLDRVRDRSHRVIVDRSALTGALSGRPSPAVLSVVDETLTVSSTTDSVELPVVVHGSPPRTAFDPAVLGPALEASVGPDVLLELSEPSQPAVVRSADQGSFTTLVMPVKLPQPGPQDQTP